MRFLDYVRAGGKFFDSFHIVRRQPFRYTRGAQLNDKKTVSRALFDPNN